MRQCVLAGLSISGGEGLEKALSETRALCEAADLAVAETFTQNLPKPVTGTLIGTGKIGEIHAYLQMTGIDLVVFDNALTPVQLRNLAASLEAEVLDRTAVILQIFADRARTREAALQVESARLAYLLPRLVGMHSDLGRQGGASGAMSNKGLGEKKIDLDRRHIERRMAELRKELEEVDRERATQRNRRLHSGLARVALVGYTNAGKSTIMNGMLRLYGEDPERIVFEKDMLFATLDTTVRRIVPDENRRPFLLSDTVGFIDRLPATLVKAFRSTLEESVYADLLLLVSDVSDPDYREHLKTTLDTLSEIGAGQIPRLFVFNKADRLDAPVSSGISVEGMSSSDRRITMSARFDQDIVRLTSRIEEMLGADRIDAELLLPYSAGHVLNYLMESAGASVEEYTEDGTRVRASLTREDAERFGKYRV